MTTQADAAAATGDTKAAGGEATGTAQAGGSVTGGVAEGTADKGGVQAKAGGEGSLLEAGKSEDKAKEGEAAKAEELTIKLPEGAKADAAVLEGFKVVAKELGLKSEGAQKLVEFQFKAEQAAIKRAEESWANQRKEWLESSKADKEFGGDKWESSLKAAQRAFGRFGGDGLKKLLAEAGIDNHPEVVRAFYRMDVATREDTVAGRHGTSGQTKNGRDGLIASMYPTMQPKE